MKLRGFSCRAFSFESIIFIFGRLSESWRNFGTIVFIFRLYLFKQLEKLEQTVAEMEYRKGSQFRIRFKTHTAMCSACVGVSYIVQWNFWKVDLCNFWFVYSIRIEYEIEFCIRRLAQIIEIYLQKRSKKYVFHS